MSTIEITDDQATVVNLTNAAAACYREGLAAAITPVDARALRTQEFGQTVIEHLPTHR